MDLKTLFLTPKGRIGRKDFWIGLVLLLVSNAVFGASILIGWLWVFASVYFAICLFAKRLHDIGRSAWLVLTPFAIMLAAALIAAVGFALTIFSMAMTDLKDEWAALEKAGFSGAEPFLFIIAGAGLICFGLIVWLGSRPGQAQANVYGLPRARNLVTII
jgi:uncharacterized membrane protein YhaH (DUF805 family)